MTTPTLGTAAETQQVPDSPAAALSAVVDNAAALARAELRLVAAEAKAWLLRIALGVVVLWFSLLLLQVFVLTAALAPIAWVDRPAINVVSMLLIALAPALAALVFGVHELRRLKDVIHANPSERPPAQRH